MNFSPLQEFTRLVARFSPRSTSRHLFLGGCLFSLFFASIPLLSTIYSNDLNFTSYQHYHHTISTQKVERRDTWL
ncbi:hypothetical protein BDZ91DRAFT_720382, partial [Kalaharituber pfeilii]